MSSSGTQHPSSSSSVPLKVHLKSCLALALTCVRAAAEGLLHAGCWPSCCLTLSGLARRREAFSLPSVMLMDIWTGPRGRESCLSVTGAL